MKLIKWRKRKLVKPLLKMKVYRILANEDIFYEKEQVRESEQITTYLAPGKFLLRFYEKRRALRLDFNSEIIDGYVSAIVVDKKKLENMIGAKGVFPLNVDEEIARPFLNLVGESSRTQLIELNQLIF